MTAEDETMAAYIFRRPMCFINDKPRSVTEYARGSKTWMEGEARVSASIQAYYDDCRARSCHSAGTWIGD